MSKVYGTHWGGRLKIYNDASSIALKLHTADGNDERRVNRLNVSAFGYSIWLTLPELIKPRITRVKASFWDDKTIARLGRDWYLDIEGRIFGVSLFEGHHLSISYGVNDINVENPKRISWFLPWKEYEHVRHSAYNLDGTWLLDYPENYYARTESKKAVPELSISFLDYDGEVNVAKVRVEEREWRRGTRGWRWLRLFYKPKIRRSLEIEYEKGSGPGKDSWKGGVLGESTDMRPGETPEAAFTRHRTDTNLKHLLRKARRDD